MAGTCKECTFSFCQLRAVKNTRSINSQTFAQSGGFPGGVNPQSRQVKTCINFYENCFENKIFFPWPKLLQVIVQ